MNTQTYHAQYNSRRKQRVAAGTLTVLLFDLILSSVLVFTPATVDAQCPGGNCGGGGLSGGGLSGGGLPGGAFGGGYGGGLPGGAFGGGYGGGLPGGAFGGGYGGGLPGGAFGGGNMGVGGDGFGAGNGGLLGGGAAGGGLLGGLLQNPLLLMMLLMMLMQLFQQGGQGTPQTGSVDEQPPVPANVYRPRPKTVSTATPTPQPTSGSSASTNSTNSENKALYLAQNLIYPSTLGIKKGERVTVYNAEEGARTVEVRYPAGSVKEPMRVEIPAEKAHVLKFSTEGTFTLCTGTGTTALECPTTVTVSP